MQQLANLGYGGFVAILVMMWARLTHGIVFTDNEALALGYVLGGVFASVEMIAKALRDTMLAALAARRRKIDNECAAPTVTAGATPGSANVTIPQPSMELNIHPQPATAPAQGDISSLAAEDKKP